MSGRLPPHVARHLRRAERLEWWTLFWLATIVGVMYFAMGSSQAMKAAWIEDMLSIIPAILFLVARKLEGRPATDAYPFGFDRGGSLGFFLAAAALVTFGLLLIYNAVSALVTQDRPSIGNVTFLGVDIWQGWLMIAALTYSAVPPVLLGHMKRPLARDTMDKILYTDADMNAADWKTALAGILGIVGIGLGYWWADAAAAGVIALDILRDGLRNIRIAVAELIDGAPRKLDSADIHPLVHRMSEELKRHYPGHSVQVREMGRFVRADLVPKAAPKVPTEQAQTLLPESDAWRLIAVNQSLPDLPHDGKPAKSGGTERVGDRRREPGPERGR